MCVYAIFFVLISSNEIILYVMESFGIYNERFYYKHSFSIFKPLSVIIAEHIGNFSKYSLFSVSFLSDTAPLYAFKTRFIKKIGNTLNLKCYHVCRLTRFSSDHQDFLVSRLIPHLHQ